MNLKSLHFLRASIKYMSTQMEPTDMYVATMYHSIVYERSAKCGESSHCTVDGILPEEHAEE